MEKMSELVEDVCPSSDLPAFVRSEEDLDEKEWDVEQLLSESTASCLSIASGKCDLLFLNRSQLTHSIQKQICGRSEGKYYRTRPKTSARDSKHCAI